MSERMRELRFYAAAIAVGVVFFGGMAIASWRLFGWLFPGIDDAWRGFTGG